MSSFRRKPPGLLGAAAIVVAVLIALLALVLVAGGRLPWLPPEPGRGDGEAAPVAVGRAAVELAGGGRTSRTAVLVGTGDIAVCGAAASAASAALLDGIAGTVFTTGDNAYPAGRAEDYRSCYDPTWGRHLHRTRPAPGNHEYRTRNAAGYREYFGPTALGPDGSTWYEYLAGTWQVIVLDSNCAEVGGCGPGSPQGEWLRDTLARPRIQCTLAIWHHPRYSSGWHGPTLGVGPFWDLLYRTGGDLVVNGHEHSYERFAPQDGEGRRDDDRGIRQLVVGTGGAELRGFGPPAPNSERRISRSHGVVRLALREGAYSWAFVSIDGSILDEGDGTCH